MACRRVLSSTPLLVRGSETGGDSRGIETYKLELTNKKYEYIWGRDIPPLNARSLTCHTGYSCY
jgi:hypothetical protein